MILTKLNPSRSKSAILTNILQSKKHIKTGNQQVKKESYQLEDHQHMIKHYYQCSFPQLETDMMSTFIAETILSPMSCIQHYNLMRDMEMH